MTAQINRTMFSADEGHRPRWLGLACATTLTAAAVVGLGAWQFLVLDGAQTREETRRPATTSAAVTTGPAAHDAASLSSSDLFAAELLYILVDTNEQADAVRRLGDHANQRRVQAGQRPARITVLVPHALDPAVLAVIWELPGVQVIDLREQ